jgi:hypothetical protein
MDRVSREQAHFLVERHGYRADCQTDASYSVRSELTATGASRVVYRRNGEPCAASQTPRDGWIAEYPWER